MYRKRQWHPTPVLLPGKSHARRGLVGCSPWGREESHTTERLTFHFSFSSIGEGNGSPLQFYCLENPRDRGAWWAAVYGVTQSRTRLKWLSSSSSRWGRLWSKWRVVSRASGGRSAALRLTPDSGVCLGSNFLMEFHQQSPLLGIRIVIWAISCLSTWQLFLACWSNF